MRSTWEENEALFGAELMRDITVYTKEAQDIEDYLHTNYGRVIRWRVWKPAPEEVVAGGVYRIREQMQRFDITAWLKFADGQELVFKQVLTKMLLEHPPGDRETVLQWTARHTTEHMVEALMSGPEQAKKESEGNT